ncbi:MAG: Gfo/Idh/MocA family oxidoreductase [Dehalococcoidia bacterium]
MVLLESAAVIGYGSIGRYHARLLNQRYKRFAIIESQALALANAKADFPDAQVVDSLAALQSTGWNWASCLSVIATWGPSHAPLFAELIELGAKHVLCEKPLANSIALGDRMVKLAKRHGITLGSHQHPQYSGFVDGLSKVAEQLQIGQPVRMVVNGGANGIVTNGLSYLAIACELFGEGPNQVISTVVPVAMNPRSTTLMFYGGTAIWSFQQDRELVVSFSNRASISATTYIFYRNAVVHMFPSLNVEIYRRDPKEVSEYPAVTRTGPATELAFGGSIPGVRAIEQSTSMIFDEIESGAIKVFPPELALRALDGCIGAIYSGESKSAVTLPIDPSSEIGQRQWPIS